MNNLIGQLKVLRDRNILKDIDLEWCRLLMESSPALSDHVALAACMVSYLYRQGDVCLPLEQYASRELFDEFDAGFTVKAPELDAWLESLQNSSAVGKAGDFKPLILGNENRLYLHKLWKYEQSLATDILERAAFTDESIDQELLRGEIPRLFGNYEEEDWQKVAAVAAVFNRFTVISGGPGTGKTTTVVRILALLAELYAQKEITLAIALAAPTGKAAARLESSVSGALETLQLSDEATRGMPSEAMTVHQLLGARRHSSRFRHHAENPLPYDVVIVDEASMIDQALMSRLMEALPKDSRLILLGDKDQLASVEAGSVLGDICGDIDNTFSSSFLEKLENLSMPGGVQIQPATTPKPLTDNIILLQKSYRFREGSGIFELAKSINSGDIRETLTLLQSDRYDSIGLSEISSDGGFKDELKRLVEEKIEHLLQSDRPEVMFDIYHRFRILAAHRKGPLGVEYLNRIIEDLLTDKGLISRYDSWYHGKPIIINRNEYSLGLNNGDIGICFEEKGEKLILFRQESGFKNISPSRIPDYSSAYALTVHKSQGSEFEEIYLVLPPGESRILSRELIYTAISRAKQKVTIAGSKEILSKGIGRKLDRVSGLGELLWDH